MPSTSRDYFEGQRKFCFSPSLPFPFPITFDIYYVKSPMNQTLSYLIYIILINCWNSSSCLTQLSYFYTCGNWGMEIYITCQNCVECKLGNKYSFHGGLLYILDINTSKINITVLGLNVLCTPTSGNIYLNCLLYNVR